MTNKPFTDVSLADIGKGWPHYKDLTLPNAAHGNEPSFTPRYSEPPYTQSEKETRHGGYKNVFARRHYRGNPPRNPSPTSHSIPSPPPATVETTGHDNHIVHQLEPFVMMVLTRFGRPTSNEVLRSLVDQVIAKAISMPEVGACMRATEMSAWGRADLLRTVTELLIKNCSNRLPVDDACTQPEQTHR